MKKLAIALLLVILALPIAFACDMEGMDDHSHGSEITGANVADYGMMSGFGMMGYGLNLIWTIIFLYFAIGLGYLIYKINRIENKLKGGKK